MEKVHHEWKSAVTVNNRKDLQDLQIIEQSDKDSKINVSINWRHKERNKNIKDQDTINKDQSYVKKNL